MTSTNARAASSLSDSRTASTSSGRIRELASDGIDSVDQIVTQWAAAWPSLQAGSVAISTRLAKLAARLDVEMEPLFASLGLTGPSFRILACLLRQGPPYRAAQGALCSALGLTPGTISVRVDTLVEAQLAAREIDPADRRGALVTLTATGRELAQQAVPAVMARERQLLSVLSDAEQQALSGLLRKLLRAFEAAARPGQPSPLGLTLASARATRRMQRAVGLPERVGLLVTDVVRGGPAAEAGIEPGDLLVSAGGSPLHSTVDLAGATRRGRSDGVVRLGVVRGVQEGERETELHFLVR